MYPALSVLQALIPGNEAGTDVSVLWVGSEKGMEADLVKRAGVPYCAIPAAGVHGVGLRALPRNLLQLGRGFLAARRVLGKFRPDVLLFTGGFVAAPLALAARLPVRGLRRPRSLVYIPDIEPGWALKFLIRFSDHVALTTADSRAFLPASARATVTGYPVRADLLGWDRSDAFLTLNLNQDLPVLAILGGSKGAHSINQAVFNHLPVVLETMQVVHLTGQLDWEGAEKILQTLPEALKNRYHPYAYLHHEIGAVLASADVVLSRAGASTLGELPLFGIPAILVPYPYAWRYQHLNADYLVERGAAVLVKDAELASKILPVLQGMMSDPERREKMTSAMRTLAKPQAAREIANFLIEMVPGTIK